MSSSQETVIETSKDKDKDGDKEFNTSFLVSLQSYIKAYESLGIHNMPELKEIASLNPISKPTITKSTAQNDLPLHERYKSLPNRIEKVTKMMNVFSMIPKMQEMVFLIERMSNIREFKENEQKLELEKKGKLEQDIQNARTVLKGINDKSKASHIEFYKQFIGSVDSIFRKMSAFKPTEELVETIIKQTYLLTWNISSILENTDNIDVWGLVYFKDLEQFKENKNVFEKINMLPEVCKKLAKKYISQERENTLSAIKLLQKILTNHSLYFKRAQTFISSKILCKLLESDQFETLGLSEFNNNYFKFLMEKIKKKLLELREIFEKSYTKESGMQPILENDLSLIEGLRDQTLVDLKKINNDSSNYFLMLVNLEQVFDTEWERSKRRYLSDSAFLDGKPVNCFKQLVQQQLKELQEKRAKLNSTRPLVESHEEVLRQERKHQKDLEQQRRAANVANQVSFPQFSLVQNKSAPGSKSELKEKAEDNADAKPKLSNEQISKLIMDKIPSLNTTSMNTLKSVLGKITPHFELEENKIIQLARDLGLAYSKTKNGFYIRIGEEILGTHWEHAGQSNTLVGDYVRDLKKVLVFYCITLDAIENLKANASPKQEINGSGNTQPASNQQKKKKKR